MLAIIGGTGLNQMPGLTQIRELQISTDHAVKPVALTTGVLDGQPLCFLPRHGVGHRLPPHRINYRANIQALKLAQATAVIAVNAVGGIHPEAGTGVISIPDQIIDYSWGREHSFFNGDDEGVEHVDFTAPYDESLRQLLLQAAEEAGLAHWPRGVYACTQGPRLETAAEIRRLKADGCDVVGMTGMPETGLAREARLPYACLALTVNWGAGLSNEEITMAAIETVLAEGMVRVRQLLRLAVSQYVQAGPI